MNGKRECLLLLKFLSMIQQWIAVITISEYSQRILKTVKTLFVSFGQVQGKGQCFKTAHQAIWDVNLIPNFSHSLSDVPCCTDTRDLTLNEHKSTFDEAGSCSLWAMQDFGGFTSHHLDLELMEISAPQNSHYLHNWECRCFQLEPAQVGGGPNLHLGFTPAWRADPCKCSHFIYPFVWRIRSPGSWQCFPLQIHRYSAFSEASPPPDPFLTRFFFTSLTERSKQINVLTSSSSAENKSGKEYLERGNLVREKQMHMGVREEQVIKGLLPLMYPAPGKQAEMKWERSCFLSRQNKRLTAWAASMQHCWVCHGLSHSQTHSELSTTGDRWKPCVWFGVFFVFLAGMYYYEKFAIKLAAIKQRKDTDAWWSISIRK